MVRKYHVLLLGDLIFLFYRLIQNVQSKRKGVIGYVKISKT